MKNLPMQLLVLATCLKIDTYDSGTGDNNASTHECHHTLKVTTRKAFLEYIRGWAESRRDTGQVPSSTVSRIASGLGDGHCPQEPRDLGDRKED